MDLRKLESEVDLKRSVEVFETLRADTNLFTGWSRAEIEKLCENIKIISYGRSATIIRKNELIEYFAIILGGKLLINQGNNVVGHLGAGDVIGYMACMDFAGTKASPFEITADVEGYIGVFRYDEFKMLSKKEPLLSYKITEMLAKKTLNAVALQYMGEEVYTPHKLKGGSLVSNTKKIKDAMDTCPELGEFFDRLDQRDRKNLVKCVEYIEFEAEQRVIYEGKKADYILILTKGELIGFREGKPAVYYKPGTILGKKEFFFELTWTENVYGKAKGVLLKLERTKYQEMVMSSTMSANNLMKSLIWHECKDIKSRYQERSVFDKVKGQTITNPLNEFVEYEITKHIDFINKQQLKLSNNKPMIKEFLLKKEVLPLYMHSIHQTLAAPPPVDLDGTAVKKPKAPETIAGCIFLREKMEKQIAERRNKKKAPGARPVKVVEPKRTAHDGIGDEDYEDLKNNYVLLEKENEELREKLNKIFDDNKGLKNQLRDLKELSVMSNTQINKTNLHKELMTKDLINNDPASFLTRNYSTTFSTFGDVLKEQHLVAMRTKRVAKYAYRWLAVVRTKRKQKLLG